MRGRTALSALPSFLLLLILVGDKLGYACPAAAADLLPCKPSMNSAPFDFCSWPSVWDCSIAILRACEGIWSTVSLQYKTEGQLKTLNGAECRMACMVESLARRAINSPLAKALLLVEMYLACCKLLVTPLRAEISYVGRKLEAPRRRFRLLWRARTSACCRPSWRSLRRPPRRPVPLKRSSRNRRAAAEPRLMAAAPPARGRPRKSGRSTGKRSEQEYPLPAYASKIGGPCLSCLVWSATTPG